MNNKDLTTAVIGILGTIFALAAWLGGLKGELLLGAVSFGAVLLLWAVYSLASARSVGVSHNNNFFSNALTRRHNDINRLELLNEDDGVTVSWDLYNKTSAVIGKDVRENQVDIDLAASEYASLVDVEHAVLNYADGSWYVEDLGSRNGVSVQKKADGRKYRLSSDQPCKLAPGDIIIIGLSRLQDSLTYFQTSIRGNENLLQKLKFKLQIDELDADLIEDVNIEMSQARETTSIYSDILESTMDTYQSIINNNMNTVMRTLTSVTIIMMIPTLITSMFGMNLINGMEAKPWGFVIAIILSIAVSGCCWWFFRHKRLV